MGRGGVAVAGDRHVHLERWRAEGGVVAGRALHDPVVRVVAVADIKEAGLARAALPFVASAGEEVAAHVVQVDDTHAGQMGTIDDGDDVVRRSP